MEIRAGTSTGRGTGVARWGWSGVEELRLPWVSAEILQRIVSLLPSRVSTVEEIGFTIIEFGARYHRNVRQDECGPTRADRMSALRTMLIRVELLDSLIVGLPQHLALELSYRSTEPDPSPSFRILRSWTILRGWTIGEIHRAANTELAVRHSLYSADDLSLLEEICTRASATIEVMCLLDTSKPKSLGGQFVGAVVEALEPPGCGIAEKLLRDASVRARKFAASSDGQARSVYSAMGDYVPGHPPIGIRRGRRKVVR